LRTFAIQKVAHKQVAGSFVQKSNELSGDTLTDHYCKVEFDLEGIPFPNPLLPGSFSRIREVFPPEDPVSSYIPRLICRIFWDYFCLTGAIGKSGQFFACSSGE
jgi:hypothetical protein